MCWNRKVIAGLALAAVAIYLLAPGSVSAALPLLFFAACPLAMLLMMRAMSGAKSTADKTPEVVGSSTTERELARLRVEVAELRGVGPRAERPLSDLRAPSPSTARDSE